MSEEERKAIEVVKKYPLHISIKTKSAICIDCINNDRNKHIEAEIVISDYFKKSLETVLNLIKKQQKEIEKNKNFIDFLQSNDVKKLGEIIKKDKIIDLMANHIATSDSDLCEYLDITTKCKYYAGDNGKTCDNCIKQYFENKAKELLNK